MSERVWAFTLARNEHVLMPYWCRHYRAFCERLIVYEDSSDDDTRQLALDGGAEVRDYASNGHLDDVAFVAFANEHYREARGHADWVVWVDADEFVYHPHLVDRLAAFRANGVSLPRTEGWGMMSPGLPTSDGQIWQEIKRGIPASAYSKIAIFDPELDLEWSPGKHVARVTSPYTVDDGSDPLKLLHYRWLGAEYFAARSATNWSRIPDEYRMWAGTETNPDSIAPYSTAWFNGRLELAEECV